MQPHKDFYVRNMPHFQPKQKTYFITYRLYNSIPISKVIEMSTRYHQQKMQLGKLPLLNRKQLQCDYFLEFDEQLDKKIYPPFWLEDERIAQIVFDSLLFNDNKEYNLWGFTIMPNHVHALISLLENSLQLFRILQKHKRFTAWQCNLILERTGHFWQPESCDHLVRNREEFLEIVNYILNNPMRAGLATDLQQWKWKYLHPDLQNTPTIPGNPFD
jgi:putative transposase